jgi:peptidoglycan/xylan/chitin deacetylase (PgdA/CDA1 family)
MTKYSKFLKRKSCTIFLFHGVIKTNNFKLRNYNNKHIEKKIFIQILKDLKKNGHPISMDDVLKNISNKTDFDNKSFVITFDDGFFNNYSIAIPILKKMQIPATFYITTDFIEKNATSWVDRIEIAVNSKNHGSTKILNKEYNFNNSIKSKIKFMNDIRKIIKNDKKIDPYKTTANILKNLDYNKKILSSNHTLDKKMDWNQIKKLDKQKLFTVGGHTKTHKILSFLSDKEVKKEINESIRLIVKKLNKKIIHYSYPEGLRHTFSNREILLLKQKGIKCCPSAESGINNKNSNLFKLKRIFCI